MLVYSIAYGLIFADIRLTLSTICGRNGATELILLILSLV